MNHLLYEPFFLQPASTWHRRYEALRLVFVDRQPLSEVADRFQVSCGTIRNWVSDFCGRYDQGEPPPFSANQREGVARIGMTEAMRKRLKLPTSRRYLWSQAVGCGPARRAYFCSGPCWLDCRLIAV